MTAAAAAIMLLPPLVKGWLVVVVRNIVAVQIPELSALLSRQILQNGIVGGWNSLAGVFKKVKGRQIPAGGISQDGPQDTLSGGPSVGGMSSVIGKGVGPIADAGRSSQFQ